MALEPFEQVNTESATSAPSQTNSCQNEGCTAEIVLHCKKFVGQKPEEWGNESFWVHEHYCPEHAPKHGYCSRCGKFCRAMNYRYFELNGICDDCRGPAFNEDDTSPG